MENILRVLVIVFAITAGQDLVFPGLEEGDEPGKQPPRLADSRFPLYIPGRCPPNQLLYPGDQKHDWICDCGLGFIYYPPKDGCYTAYRQGPCENNQYLVLPKKKVIPECVENPCKPDGYVPYNGTCYELGTKGPCLPSGDGESGVFSVNKTTLALECLKGPSILSLISFPPNCPPGSRRGVNCRQEYKRK